MTYFESSGNPVWYISGTNQIMDEAGGKNVHQSLRLGKKGARNSLLSFFLSDIEGSKSCQKADPVIFFLFVQKIDQA